MLTTISFHHRHYWLFRCECGNETIQVIRAVSSGKIKSCGCYHKIESTIRAREQFTKHDLSKTRVYHIWKYMKSRCLNPNTKAYRLYGERGITVCDEWENDFQPFYDWALSHGYSDILTIDRINNDGNYEPSNCRWATMKEQCNNTRLTHHYYFNGEVKTLSEWAATLDLPRKTINDRLKSGWTIDRALTQPINMNISNAQHKYWEGRRRVR